MHPIPDGAMGAVWVIEVVDNIAQEDLHKEGDEDDHANDLRRGNGKSKYISIFSISRSRKQTLKSRNST